MTEIIDFQIKPAENGHFSAEIIQRGASEPVAVIPFILPNRLFETYPLRASQLANPTAALELLTETGQHLYQTLFLPNVRQQLDSLSADRIVICIRIASAVDFLEYLPWEALHNGRSFLISLDEFAVTRLPSDGHPLYQVPDVAYPLKSFVLLSMPENLGSAVPDKTDELEMLLLSMDESVRQGKLKVNFESHAEIDAVDQRLSEAFDIFHFVGPGADPESEGGLLLVDDDGAAVETTVADMLHAVRNSESRLRLMILTGYLSCPTDQTASFLKVARGMLRRRIPAVLAQQYAMSEDAGLLLDYQIYSTIGKSGGLTGHISDLRRQLLQMDEPVLQMDALAMVMYLASDAPLNVTTRIDDNGTTSGEQDGLSFQGRSGTFRKFRQEVLFEKTGAVLLYGREGIGKTTLSRRLVRKFKSHFQKAVSLNCRTANFSPELIVRELHKVLDELGMPDLQWTFRNSFPPEKLALRVSALLNNARILVVFDNLEAQVVERNGQNQLRDSGLTQFLETLIFSLKGSSVLLFLTARPVNLVDPKSGLVISLELLEFDRPDSICLTQNLPNLNRLGLEQKLRLHKVCKGLPLAFDYLNICCENAEPAESLLNDWSRSPEPAAAIAEYIIVNLPVSIRELLIQLAAFPVPVDAGVLDWLRRNKPGSNLPENPDNVPAASDAIDADLESLISHINTDPDDSDPDAETVNKLIRLHLIEPIRKKTEILGLSVRPIIRRCCRDLTDPDIWHKHLCSAAAFFQARGQNSDPDRMTLQEIFSQFEAAGLWIEAGEFRKGAEIILKITSEKNQWGLDRLCESQLIRLLEFAEDRLRASIHYRLGRIKFRRFDFHNALQDFLQMQAVSSAADDTAMSGKACLHIGETRLMLEKHADALKDCSAAREHFQKSGELKGLAETARLKGRIHRSLKDFDDAWMSFEEASRIYGDLQDEDGLGEVMHELGLIHADKKEIENAMAHFENAISSFKRTGNQPGIARSLFEIGRISRIKGETRRAVELLEDTRGMMIETDDYKGVAGVEFEIGMIRRDQKEYIRAVRAMEKARKIYEAIEYEKGQADTCFQIGLVYRASSNFKLAVEYLNEAIEMNDHLNNQAGLAESHHGMGLLNLEICEFDTAFFHLVESLMEWLHLKSSRANQLIPDLKALRTQWGGKKFDRAWEERTGKPVPDGFKQG